jgi:polyketide synthase 13
VGVLQEKLKKFSNPGNVFMLQAVWEALEDAGITAQEIYGTRTGCFVADYLPILPLPSAPDETALRGQLMSSMSDQINYFYGLHGPSINIDTACSSSLVALAQAVNSLRQGHCDYALVVAANLRAQRDYQLMLDACGVLNHTGYSHPFDEDGAKGYIRCEGVGAIVLRRLSDAERDGNSILCEMPNAVAGSAGPEDGAVEGCGRVYEQPCVAGIESLMRLAYQSAEIPLEQVRYVEAHATGTAVGDLMVRKLRVRLRLSSAVHHPLGVPPLPTPTGAQGDCARLLRKP